MGKVEALIERFIRSMERFSLLETRYAGSDLAPTGAMIKEKLVGRFVEEIRLEREGDA